MSCDPQFDPYCSDCMDHGLNSLENCTAYGQCVNDGLVWYSPFHDQADTVELLCSAQHLTDDWAANWPPADMPPPPKEDPPIDWSRPDDPIIDHGKPGDPPIKKPEPKPRHLKAKVLMVTSTVIVLAYCILTCNRTRLLY